MSQPQLLLRQKPRVYKCHLQGNRPCSWRARQPAGPALSSGPCVWRESGALRAAPPGPQPARRMSVTRGTGTLNTWHKCVFLERMWNVKMGSYDFRTYSRELPSWPLENKADFAWRIVVNLFLTFVPLQIWPFNYSCFPAPKWNINDLSRQACRTAPAVYIDFE